MNKLITSNQIIPFYLCQCIPYYFLDHDVTTDEKGRGVIPDIIVDQTIEDLISGEHKEIEIVRSMIK